MHQPWPPGRRCAWHGLFGFEVSREAILSPSHLWLAISVTVVGHGLLRNGAAWRTGAGAGGERLRLVDLPVVLALGILFRLALWYLTYALPLSTDYASGGAITGALPGYAGIDWRNEAAQVAGTMGLLLYSLLLALFLVVPLRHLRLPGGAITLIMLYEAALIAATTDLWRYLPAVLGAALVGEAVWSRVRRGGLGGPTNEAGYWLLACIVPLVQVALYVALMAAFGGGVIWTTPLWLGMPVVAGLFGLFAGMLAVPPRFLQPA